MNADKETRPANTIRARAVQLEQGRSVFICVHPRFHSRFHTPTPRHDATRDRLALRWFRLAVSVLVSTIGGVGMWSVVVALPAVQAEFHAERGAASLPFTLTMIGSASAGSSWAGWRTGKGLFCR
jgi:hypothetical protein